MKNLSTCAILLIALTAILSAPGRNAAGAGNDLHSHWCSIRVKGYEIDSDIFFVTVMPNESVELEVIPNTTVEDIRWLISAGRLTSEGPNRKTYTAPSKSDMYELQVRGRAGDRTVIARIKIFVLVPYSRMKNGYIEGFKIGEYPDPKNKRSPEYKPPPGFIRVTRENKDQMISEYYELEDFLCNGPEHYPQFLVLNEALIVKLEMVTHEFQKLGLLKGRISFLSAYRTPAYNVKPGQAKFSRHMWGSALDIFINNPKKTGWMDDLTRDGVVDIRDSILMYKVIDSMYHRGMFKDIQGGLGIYPPTNNHGPFVHMDVRTNPYRWANDRDGRKVKNLDAWLKLPENYVRLPAGVPNIDYAQTQPPSGGMETRELRSKIRDLEQSVAGLEEKARNMEESVRPLDGNDLYIAADVTDGMLLINRGRVIMARAGFEAGRPSLTCPAGLADIYSLPSGVMKIRRNKLEPTWFHPPWALLGYDLPGTYSQTRTAFFSASNLESGIDLGAGSRIYGAGKKLNMALPGCLVVSSADLKNISSQIDVGTRVYMFEVGSINLRGENEKKRKDLTALYYFLKMREKAADLGSEYLVIDAARERGFLKEGEKVILNFPIRKVGPNFSKAFPNAAREFRLPKGIFFVKSKIERPPWYKPDWLFQEQRRRVPPPLGPNRIQTGLLGNYGIYIGAGIVIHGIHDNKVPDKSIDYVAIELKDNDLAKVWKAVSQGGLVILR